MGLICTKSFEQRNGCPGEDIYRVQGEKPGSLFPELPGGVGIGDVDCPHPHGYKVGMMAGMPNSVWPRTSALASLPEATRIISRSICSPTA